MKIQQNEINSLGEIIFCSLFSILINLDISDIRRPTTIKIKKVTENLPF